jgi:hypothetical protein
MTKQMLPMGHYALDLAQAFNGRLGCVRCKGSSTGRTIYARGCLGAEEMLVVHWLIVVSAAMHTVL